MYGAPPPRWCLALLVASALTTSGPALGAATTDWNLKLGAMAGYDSNPHRGYRAEGLADASLWGTAGLSLTHRAESFLFDARYRAGGQLFAVERAEFLTQRLALTARLAPARVVDLELRGSGFDERSPYHPQSDLSGQASIAWRPDTQFMAQLWGGPRRFLDQSGEGFSFFGPELGASFVYRFDSAHRLSVHGSYSRWWFGRQAQVAGEVAESSPRRTDHLFTAGAGYGYRRAPVRLELEYRYLDQTSNSDEGVAARHRGTLTGALALPGKLLLLVRATIQAAQYSQPRSVTPLDLSSEEETRNAVIVELERRLSEVLFVAGRYGLHLDWLRGEGEPIYRRQEVSLGLRLEL